MVRLAELIVILELHQQGMTVSAIARRTGLHRSTVAKYIARGIEPPAYGPRSPRPTKLTPFERYLRERIAAVPELTGSRLCREIRGLGYAGGYTALKDFLRQVRPRPAAGFEIYDADGIAALFTEDATWDSPGLGRFEGRNAIRSFSGARRGSSLSLFTTA